MDKSQKTYPENQLLKGKDISQIIFFDWVNFKKQKNKPELNHEKMKQNHLKKWKKSLKNGKNYE